MRALLDIDHAVKDDIGGIGDCAAEVDLALGAESDMLDRGRPQQLLRARAKGKAIPFQPRAVALERDFHVDMLHVRANRARQPPYPGIAANNGTLRAELIRVLAQGLQADKPDFAAVICEKLGNRHNRAIALEVGRPKLFHHRNPAVGLGHDQRARENRLSTGGQGVGDANRLCQLDVARHINHQAILRERRVVGHKGVVIVGHGRAKVLREQIGFFVGRCLEIGDVHTLSRGIRGGFNGH